MSMIFLEGSFRTSPSENLGILLLLAFPLLLFIALILALAKKKKAAKTALLFSGVSLLIGAGLCGLG